MISLTDSGSAPRKTIFTREATGLVREFSPFTFLAFTINVVGIQYSFYYMASLTPLIGGNIFLPFFLAIITCLGGALVVYSMITIMPRSGGDYVYVSRTLNPAVGFVGNLSWGIMAGLLFVAINAVTIESTALSILLGYLGVTFSNSSLLGWAATLGSPAWTFGLGTFWIVLAGIVATLAVRRYIVVQNILFIAIIVGVVATIVAFAATSHSTFVQSFNAFASQYKGNSTDYYNGVISAATSSGWSRPTVSLLGSLALFPAFGFLGMFNWGSQVAGELRTPKKSLMWGLVGGVIVSYGLVFAMLVLLYNTAGSDFLSAIDFLLYNNPSAVPLPALPYANMLIAPAVSPVLALIVILSGFVQLFVFMPSIYTYISRGFLAYSLDGILPKWFGDVSDRTHSPVNSIVTSVIISEVLLITISIPLTAQFVYLLSSVLSMWVAIFPTTFIALSAILLAKLKPEYERLSPIKGAKLVVLGLLLLVYCICMIYFTWVTPAYGAQSPVGLGIAVGATAVIACVYLVARVRKGSKLRLAFAEIPPE